MKLFLDESGNTGSDWLNPDQPYFVYGGWLIPDAQCVGAREIIKTVFWFSKAKELKSKDILSGKRRYFFEMVELLIDEAHALPVFVVADKSYMVAAKIVETFFDYAHNPHVNEYLTQKSNLKKALADFVSQDDDLLCKFGKILNKSAFNLTSMKDIRDKLATHFFDNDLGEVGDSISQLSDLDLTMMMDEYSDALSADISKAMSALTAPLLMQIIIDIDKSKYCFKEDIEIYADKLIGYSGVFDEIETICQRKKLVKNIKKIYFCNSLNDSLIQASDLLSGYVARTFRDINTVALESNSQRFWKKLVDLRDQYVERGVLLWDFDAHSNFLENISKIVGGSYHYSENPRDIIVEKFHNAIKR